MATMLINDVEIYYELTGESGEVLTILNGIMMSSGSWTEIKKDYIKSGYRILTVDFRDQGKSGSSPVDYEIEQHAEDLKVLLDQLAIKKTHILGISYGGQVGMIFALKYKKCIGRLILANTSSRLSNFLKGIGDAWDEAAKLYDGERFFRIAMPLIYSDVFYETHYDWLKEREKSFKDVLTKNWFTRYLRLSSSHGKYNIEAEIYNIEAPTLVIGADRDIVTPYEETYKIYKKITNASFVMIPECGHASCYEKPQEFNIQVLGFLGIRRLEEEGRA
ncbi:alpha/beta fold hydrolase [Isachenkonia alkalipeptolytica]|uniref:Alpha/beta hydrolase n=1 Tax=Isachenkonia alkalipeptolytica TaxID=2565777 RepID=A0AA43XKL0_9CLOT|nr:alpha/beta hydrolase [Isachenkonia alkalipeptolytica]NBG88442.1 alpha/beta hydrolase [Isachenkonia alkalipeptolytica]